MCVYCEKEERERLYNENGKTRSHRGARHLMVFGARNSVGDTVIDRYYLFVTLVSEKNDKLASQVLQRLRAHRWKRMNRTETYLQNRPGTSLQRCLSSLG